MRNKYTCWIITALYMLGRYSWIMKSANWFLTVLEWCSLRPDMMFARDVFNVLKPRRLFIIWEARREGNTHMERQTHTHTHTHTKANTHAQKLNTYTGRKTQKREGNADVEKQTHKPEGNHTNEKWNTHTRSQAGYNTKTHYTHLPLVEKRSRSIITMIT